MKSVTKLVKPILCFYLALSLMFGGLVGIVPALHQLVEHGGRGPLHTHHDALTCRLTMALSHEEGSIHSRSHFPEPLDHNGLFVHSYAPFRFPSLPLARFWHGLCHFTELNAPGASEPSRSKDGPGHEHHSLAQMMINGLVDQPIDIPLLGPLPTSYLSQDFQTNPCFVESLWDAQTAGRGPPSAQS